MKLSKLYSNQPHLFNPIYFNSGLNVVLAEIRLPENKKLDTHNLGKTTLARLLDFVFLAKRNKEQFLFKNFDIFKDFIFFLEIEISQNNYLTIRRSVNNNTKISFITHLQQYQDFSDLNIESWEHSELSFNNSRTYLENQLNFNVLKNWDYRDLISYLIRIQSDFSQVFKLNKHKGKDKDWKPYMADLLGFDGNLASQHYEQLSEIEKIANQMNGYKDKDIKVLIKDLSEVDNKLVLRNNELNQINEFTKTFNFNEIDQQKIENLVKNIDIQIAEENFQEYSIKNNIARIEQSLEVDIINFNPAEVKELFDEVNILFPNQIMASFNQLIEFNKEITFERNGYLNEELVELKNELLQIQSSIKALNDERAKHLSFLAETELIEKFRKSNLEIARIQADINLLLRDKDDIESILDLNKKKKELEVQIQRIEELMQSNVLSVNSNMDSRFSKIRIYFNDIINKVLDKEGTLTVFLNQSSNFEFEANYQNKQGNITSESDGHSYQKFLCIAFDLAVARAYIDDNFPKFIYIDGVFDGLDNRKKTLLLQILKEYCSLGLQIIITTINSEINSLITDLNDNIIVRLHDDGNDGKLFKLPTW